MWLGGAEDAVDSFEEAWSRAFDDSGLAVALETGQADGVLGSVAVARLMTLGDRLREVPLDQPVAILVGSGEMEGVRTAAQQALEALPPR